MTKTTDKIRFGIEIFLWAVTIACVLSVIFAVWLWFWDQPVHYSKHRYWWFHPAFLTGIVSGGAGTCLCIWRREI